MAQKHDYIWQVGYSNADNPQDSIWGRTVIDFNSTLSEPHIWYNGFPTMDFQLNNSAISDKEGNFLFTYNGHKIESHSGFFMENGYAVGPLMKDNDLLLQGSIILSLMWEKILVILKGRFFLFMILTGVLVSIVILLLFKNTMRELVE